MVATSLARRLPRRFDIFLVALDPTAGSEILKTRPCLVISPDEMNSTLRTVIVAPMTTRGKVYPSRIPCRFQGKDGFIALDQLRTVDQVRLVRHLGAIERHVQRAVLDALSAMFAP